MSKRGRAITKASSTRVNDATVIAVPVEGAADMVTLEGPEDDTGVRDAFVRLRPPAGMTPQEIEAWRADVASEKPKAIRVMPAMHGDAVIPFEALRNTKALDPRSVIKDLVKAANYPDKKALSAKVEQFASEVKL